MRHTANMDDELEDEVLYQAFLSHMKLISKFAVGLPLNSAPVSYLWRVVRVFLLKPEVLVFSAVLLVLIFYLQSVEVLSRNLIQRVQSSLRFARFRGPSDFLVNASGPGEKLSWELKEGNIAAYAVQGRRTYMEDRFAVAEYIDDTDVSLYAVFDGHGGDFAAEYARAELVKNLQNKLSQLKKMATNKDVDIKKHVDDEEENYKDENKKENEKIKKEEHKKDTKKKDSFKKDRKCLMDDCAKGTQVTDPELMALLNDVKPRPLTRDTSPMPTMPNKTRKATQNLSSYLLGPSKIIDYARLFKDEVLAADKGLLEKAKLSRDVAGTTALIAVIDGSKLAVANVGDSRGVLCDSKGRAVPLSFDHKPQQLKEQRRIQEAGGFVAFNGVWRVAGILATSRALGDYPLKDRNLVIADPDVLTFDLADIKPMFAVLASDGLWDAFSNEEAIAYIKERLDEPHFGAKSITLQAYYRGSLDNITVVVINFMQRQWASATISVKK